MFVLGFGISMDVEGLRLPCSDRDQSPESRDYIRTSPVRVISAATALQNDAELGDAWQRRTCRWRWKFRPDTGDCVSTASRNTVPGSMALCHYRVKPRRGYIARAAFAIYCRSGDEVTGDRPQLLHRYASRYRWLTRISVAFMRWCRR